MSMITRCPQCSTMFTVVADQLRISEGWVRCGQCGNIFDGAMELQPTVGAVETEAPAKVPEELAADSFRADASSLTPAAHDEMPLDNDEAPAEIAFVRQAKRKAFWSKPWVRSVQGVFVLLLVAALALQVALRERDRLAAFYPDLRTTLERMCGSLNCVLAAPKMIDAVAVEHASFNRLRGESYRFLVTLHNGSVVDVAMPSIELSLLDAREEVLLRRVLHPQDFPAAPKSIAAQADWSGKLVVNLSDAGFVSRVTGYRTLAFYP
jgi:predicted Zn finger-like uncharacterized protein